MHDWRHALRRHLAGAGLDPVREAAIVDEVAGHLDQRFADLVAGGATDEQALQLTLDELARSEALRLRLEAFRRPVPLGPPGTPGPRVGAGLWQDARHALRSLRRQPAFALLAIVTLAVGIGLNTAMFSFVNTLLFRPMPFPDVDRLARLFRTTETDVYGRFSAAEYLALAGEQGGFGRVAAYTPASLALDDGGSPTEWLRVTPNLFEVMGVPPLIGRPFRPDDARAGTDRVVLISQPFWETRFGSAPDVVGRTLRAAGESYEIVGVLAPSASDHRLFGQVGIFSPLRIDVEEESPQARRLEVIGRRDPAIPPARAEAFLAATGKRIAAAQGDHATRGWRSEALPQSATGPTGRAILALLLGLSGFVLLIACVNLANLLLARTLERGREFAVRAALGASRWQLVRILALESLALAGAGGAAALVVATWTTGWLRALIVHGGGPSFEFVLDWRVLAFASAVSLVTTLAFGIVPAVMTSRLDVNVALKAGGRGTTSGPGSRRARHALVVSELALALMLVAGAGFFLRGMTHVLAADHGWAADGVIQGELNLPAERYPDEGLVPFYRDLVARLRQVPGVADASVSYGLPYLGLRGRGRYLSEAGPRRQRDAGVFARINGVSPGYFAVTGTRLTAGRAFVDRDSAASPAVAIVSQSMARVLYGGEAPIGRRVAADTDGEPRWLEIVGVASDVQPVDMAEDDTPFQLYQPVAQDPRRDAVLAVRTASDSAAGPVVAAVRRVITAVDPELAVRDLMPVQARADQMTSQLQMVLALLTAFAGVGLLLAALGIYGAMARMVVHRTSEIGLRMALGAPARGIARLILGAALRLVLVGLAIGLPGAYLLGRLLRSVLPGLQPDAPAVAAAALTVLVLAALAAAYAPAHRAARVDPLEALRNE